MLKTPSDGCLVMDRPPGMALRVGQVFGAGAPTAPRSRLYSCANRRLEMPPKVLPKGSALSWVRGRGSICRVLKPPSK